MLTIFGGNRDIKIEVVNAFIIESTNATIILQISGLWL